MSDYIIFTVNQGHYALEVSHIERIDQVPALTPIPNAHPYIDGMMTYHDQTAKVVNFRKMTDVHTEEPPESSQKLLIYRNENRFFAIKVDAIKDIAAFDDTMIKPYAHQVKVGSYLQTRGVVEYKNALVIVIDSIALPHDEAA